eukprot:TRINITY_DN5522_c0_g1_i2.p1 TRINITY_DN5522_c0_g1~~TRINITY_DN5522_c0_g1_i2.p1  ORF type:complete len:981 (+),score=219.79 TRINITY_DN5522_c0_g1_i2:47-2944(+)
MGDWEGISNLVKAIFIDEVPKEIAEYAAISAWYLKDWDILERVLNQIPENTTDGSFYRAIINIQNNNLPEATYYIHKTRNIVDDEVNVLIGESYQRAYSHLVLLQQLSEMEEIIIFKREPKKQETILNMWRKRLEWCQKDVDVWRRILAVRSIAISPNDDLQTWIKFSSLCIKSGKLDLARKSLINLMSNNSIEENLYENPMIAFAYIKEQWAEGHHDYAFDHLKKLYTTISGRNSLQAKISHRIGLWKKDLGSRDDEVSLQLISEVSRSYHIATQLDPRWYKSWHAWAMNSLEAVQFCSGKGPDFEAYLGAAILGFVKSIMLRPDNNLQDVLRLLTLWFQHAEISNVNDEIEEAISQLPLETWLQVIPQIIARIHHPSLRENLHNLLVKVGSKHPQALVYTLPVATKSTSHIRSMAAKSIMNELKSHSLTLVNEATLVSKELIRVAILWAEIWNNAISSFMGPCQFDHTRCAYLDRMPSQFAELHNMISKKTETPEEQIFLKNYGKQLNQALEWTNKYRKSESLSDLREAWDGYVQVFRKLHRQHKITKQLELKQVSPQLLEERDMELVVPGTYEAGTDLVRTTSFDPVIEIMNSRQRPRRLTINGNDGLNYTFLLKGNEDLRQDERVMQLFELINALLKKDLRTRNHYLSIEQYAVIPLSPNSGLIGWVLHSDTFHELIYDYRKPNGIEIEDEYTFMTSLNPNYENAPLDEKVKIFEQMLQYKKSDDLEKVLWLKSPSSEVWLDRRTTYTRSLAVMSMAGYIIGLGDRHPYNLMLDRNTGKVIHIDFGDCFEVAMTREFWPEKVPFRLTRMLVNAMEVSGIEGNFRSTCENVTSVMRDHKESLLAVLEAFVYDPLVTWRLIKNDIDQVPEKPIQSLLSDGIFSETPRSNASYSPYFEAEAESPQLDVNERAMEVINRIKQKLSGKDFGEDRTLDVEEQIAHLIDEATSTRNLCQSFLGWCSFW